MNGRRWFLLAILLCHAVAANSVTAVVSFTVFHKYSKSGADSAYLEIYWQIDPASLHYHKNDKGELTTELQTAVSIADDQTVLQRDRYTYTPPPFLPADARKQKMTALKRYALPQGNITVGLNIGEAEFPGQTFQYERAVTTTPPAGPYLSRIQLLDTFYKDPAPGLFLKNGNQHYPRTVNFYDEGQQQLHFYTELYGRKDNQPLIQQFYLSKKPGDFPIVRFQLADTISTQTHTYHTFDLATLSSGNYYINAWLQDTTGTLLDSQSFFFQMINKAPKEVVVPEKDSTALPAKEGGYYLDMSKTFVSKFNIRQLLAILKMISPLADPAEESAIRTFQKKPDELYIRYFIYNYFSKKNKAHPEEEWKTFSGSIKEVNNLFNAGGRMGYETDRGIIYLKYGKPDERLHVPNEAGAVPYEVWRYNVIGKTNQLGTFIFYQPAFSMSDYKYLTSNVTGELQNAAWKSMLYSTGRSSGNSNSRAEQYMEGK